MIGDYITFNSVQVFCPRCHCDINNFTKYVGTSTVSAICGRGSYQERKSYHTLYGDLMFSVPHYGAGEDK